MFRLVRAIYTDVLRSRSGRFTSDGDTNTSYGSPEIGTTWKEVTARFGSARVNPDAFQLVKISAQNLKLVDLTDEQERDKWQADKGLLLSPVHSQHCKDVAQRIRAAGFHGLIYQSVRDQPDGLCVVLFLENAETFLTVEAADDDWEQFITSQGLRK